MTDEETWLADPTVAWIILLAATPVEPLSPSEASRRYAELARTHEHLPAGTEVLEGAEPEDLLTRLAQETTPAEPLRLGLAGGRLVIAAHHHLVDGLGLLAVLGALTHSPVSSSARGLGERGTAGPDRTQLPRRLLEVLARPSARVAGSATSPVGHDVFAQRELPGAVATADLVWAGARAVASWNRERGRRARRLSVAVGASTRSGASPAIGYHSALLRLTGVETMSIEDVRSSLRAAAPQEVFGPGRRSGLAALLARGALRVLAARLGSTLLVSHLGTVTAPGATDLDFYPVTGGGSGLSLGAVTQAGRTRLTLRARGRQHDAAGLEEILETLCVVLTDGGAGGPGRA